MAYVSPASLYPPPISQKWERLTPSPVYLLAVGGVLVGVPHFTRKTAGLLNIQIAEFVHLKDEVVKSEVVRIK